MVAEVYIVNGNHIWTRSFVSGIERPLSLATMAAAASPPGLNRVRKTI